MSYMKGIFFYFMLWLYCMNFNCQCHGISTREAKSFFESRSNPYLMTNNFTPMYTKKEGFKGDKTKKQMEMNHQIMWGTKDMRKSSGEESFDKNGFPSELGDTNKIVTVRVSSSVARSAWKGYAEKPIERMGFGVEMPKASTRYDFHYRDYPAEAFWVTTEAPTKYYETRVEAVSSRQQVVFGRPAPTTTPQYEYYQEPQEEFCGMPETNYELPEKNYEVEEAVSLMTNRNDDRERTLPGDKLGYVMEGRDFRKYRVEERTSDGFIVGEYGFIRNEDGRLHGVRYTADISTNPQLIYEALVKFLSL